MLPSVLSICAKLLLIQFLHPSIEFIIPPLLSQQIVVIPALNDLSVFQRYMVLESPRGTSAIKYIRILKDGYMSMDMAQNILVIKTVSGMAMAVAAALDAIQFHEIVGCIAGDDTIMCAIRSVDDTIIVMEKIKKMVED